MNRIVEYRAVTAQGDCKELNRQVNALISQGFQPFGSIATTVGSDAVYFTQAMVKYGDTEQTGGAVG